MGEIDVVVLVSRWLHIGAVVVAIGGAAFLRFVLTPAASSTLSEEDNNRLREAVRARWNKFVQGCVGLLLLTGGINFAMLAMPPKIEPMPYHAIFGIKFFAAMAVFFIASGLAGKSPAFDGMRAKSKKWLSLLLFLAAAIVLMSGVLAQVRSAGKSVSETTESVAATTSQPDQ